MSESCCSSQSHSLDSDSCYHDTTNPGYLVERRRYEPRIRRVGGQVRGIDRMIGNEEHRTDVLTQISAVNSVLESLVLTLLDVHLHHRVVRAVEDGQKELDAKLEEVSAVVTRLAKQLPGKFREREGGVMKRSDEMAVGFRFWSLVAWVVSRVPLKRLVFPGDWRVLGKPGLLGSL